MAVIKFTDADIMQSTTVQPGIYPSEISKIELKAAKSGKSNNYWTDIRITDGPYKGKEITILFNTESNPPGALLGDLKVFPTSAFTLIHAAILGRPVVVGDEFDTDTCVGLPFDSQWVVATVDGRLVNDVVAFFKSGYGATAPSF